MDIYMTCEEILEKYDNDTDYVIGFSFLREPFIDDFRALSDLQDDEAFVGAFERFMTIAHETFRWDDYLQARTTAEDALRTFYQSEGLPQEKLEGILNSFIVSFFNQNIDESFFTWEEAHPGEEYPAAPDDDIDTLYLARVFSMMTCTPEDDAICQRIGIQFHYEQLHMCCWFSSQITKGTGNYTRDEPNYSARATYNRLLNPRSLLWIGLVLGADKNELTAAAGEMAGKKTNAAKCAAVRRRVPFDALLPLYKKILTGEAN